MLIGILQTGHFLDGAATVGDYDDLFRKMLQDRGFTFRTWNVVDMEFPETPEDAEGWLITGSKHGAYDALPFISPLEDFIRRTYAAGVPMVGICFGHQIIAQALGGRVEKFRNGWAVGRHLYEIDGETVPLNAWHQDQVVERPAGSEVFGRSPFCENAALVYGDKALTVQPHPEFGRESIEELLAARRGAGVVPEDKLDEVEARIGDSVGNGKIVERIADFFLKGAAHHG